MFVGVDPVRGRKRYVSKTVRGGKREAQGALSALVAEADNGMVAKRSAAVGDLLEQWFDQAKEEFSP